MPRSWTACGYATLGDLCNVLRGGVTASIKSQRGLTPFMRPRRWRAPRSVRCRIDDAMHFYGDKLGLAIDDTLELPDRQLKVAFVKADNISSSYSSHRIRIHPGALSGTTRASLAPPGVLATPDIREHLRDLRDKGVDLIDESPDRAPTAKSHSCSSVRAGRADRAYSDTEAE